MNSVLGVTLADFQERSRRFSFIAIMALALFAAFWFVPRDDGSFQVMTIQPDRFMQAGNSSWIPISSAWGAGFFLSLAGFFYLRNTISFDEKSGVSQLISTSQVGNVRYMLGKFLSGTLQLYCFAAVVMLGSLFMMLWHFPNQILSAFDFLSPYLYLLFTLPFCSALAVLFESSRFLRGAIGSVLYFAAFLTLYFMYMMKDFIGFFQRIIDFSGASVIYPLLSRVVLEQSGEPLTSISFMSFSDNNYANAAQETQQLIFHGIPVTGADIQAYIGMLAVVLAVILVSAPVYNLSKVFPGIKRLGKNRGGHTQAVTETGEPKSIPVYKPILPAQKTNALIGISAELRLLLSAQPLVWTLTAICGIISCLFLELSVVQSYVLPLLMLWSVNVFSAMGSREHRHDILKCISTIPSGRLKQVLFSWASGITVALLLSCPVMLRMLLAEQYGGVFAAAAGVIFLPSFALFLGEITKTGRAFELILVADTYLVLNGVPALMYIGTNPDVLSFTRSAVYLALGIVMGVTAVLKRA